MLSKVLKGDGARQVRSMTFAAAPAAVNELRALPASSRPAGEGAAPEGERGALAERIRTLEAELAAARRESFETGRQQGEQAARAALTPVIGRLNASIAEVIGMRPGLRQRAEKDAVELAMQIARRVLHRELSVDVNALNALARVVFDRLARAESWQLTVHPQFADAIRGALPAGGATQVRVEADPSCDPGTLLVRSAEGVIDASVESQLDEIGHGLTDRLSAK